MEKLQKIDEYFFRLINLSGGVQMDEIMILISSKWMWIPLYVFILFILYKKFSNEFLKIIFSLGLLIFLSDFGSVELFKEVFQRARPCYFLKEVRVVDGCGGPFGFISSHAANSFAIAFFISFLFKNYWWFLTLISCSALVGISIAY